MISDFAIPQFMKHFSVGATGGIFIGLLLGLFFSKTFIIISLVIYGLAFGFGFYTIKDEYVDFANKT